MGGQGMEEEVEEDRRVRWPVGRGPRAFGTVDPQPYVLISHMEKNNENHRIAEPP